MTRHFVADNGYWGSCRRCLDGNCLTCDGVGGWEDWTHIPGEIVGFVRYSVDPDKPLWVCITCNGFGVCPACLGEGEVYTVDLHEVPV